MKTSFLHLIILIGLLFLFATCATSFQHQKHKRTFKYVESNQVKSESSAAYQASVDDPFSQEEIHKKSSDALDYASVEDGEPLAAHKPEIVNDIQTFRSSAQQPVEQTKSKVIKITSSVFIEQPPNEEIAERYRQKANIAMTFFFVALGIGIVLCFFLGDFLAFGAVMGSMFQMLFQLIHLNMRKKQIRYTEDEEIKKRATRMKWLLNVMFLLVVITGTALLLVSLFIL